MLSSRAVIMICSTPAPSPVRRRTTADIAEPPVQINITIAATTTLPVTISRRADCLSGILACPLIYMLLLPHAPIHLHAPYNDISRSEERHVGKESVSTCCTRWYANT